MIALLVAHVPERQARLVERREFGDCGLEERRLRRGALSQEALDVALERSWRRLSGGRPGARGSHRQALRDSLVDGEEILQGRVLGDLRLQPPDVHPDAVRLHGQLVTFQTEGSGDDLRSPDELSNLDHRRVTERCRHGQVQLLEGAHSLVAGDRRQAACVQLLGEQHRRGLAQPRQPGFSLGVLERDDEDAGRCGGVSRRALGTTVRDANGQDHERGGSREDLHHRAGHAAADSPAVACRMMTDIEQIWPPPAARHASICASPGTAKSCRTREIAAA